MKIVRYFTKELTTPYETIDFVPRVSLKNDRSGNVIERIDLIGPALWSQTAIDILTQKYMRQTGVPQPDGTLGRETDARQVFDRLAKAWTYWGTKEGYFTSEEDAQAFCDEMKYMLAHQIAAPNSPQWFNTGLHLAYGIEGPAQGLWRHDLKTNETAALANAYEHNQSSACFIQSIEDTLTNEGGIMDLYHREARLFKFGSGSGSNFSPLRGEGERLSGGGKSSGLMSFLKIGDSAAGAIKSGGTTRRAAKMVIINIDHPDIEAFIQLKVKEEQKVAALIAGSQLCATHLNTLLQAIRSHGPTHPLTHQARTACEQAGVPSTYIDRTFTLAEMGHTVSEFITLDYNWEGEAYQTVTGQNANNSVRIPSHFFDVVDGKADWSLIARTTGQPIKTVKANALWDQLCTAAWQCADPGVQFDTTINEWHTTPAQGRINASNPCSEYMSNDDTACNLASLNLTAFIAGEHNFDLAGYRHAIRLWTIALDITVTMSGYPSQAIAERTAKLRQLGLGYANLGALLMRWGIPYDSPKGRAYAAALAAIMTGEAYSTSASIAAHLGPFAHYKENEDAMLRVIRNHARAAGLKRLGNNHSDTYEGLSVPPQAIDYTYIPEHIRFAVTTAWETAYMTGSIAGFRNAQVTVIAPTGTIGLLMDCDTTGIEPDFALVKHKTLAGGGHITLINQSIPAALETLGYGNQQILEITQALNDTGNLEHAPHLSAEHLAIFDCANACGATGTRAIDPAAHVLMLTSVQPFISGSISKTANLPEHATVADIDRLYRLTHRLGGKCLSIYRNNSKLSQPLTAHKTPMMDNTQPAHDSLHTPTTAPSTEQLAWGTHKPLPNRRDGHTQKVIVGGHKLFIKTGEYADGTVGEIFLDMHKEGAAFRSLMNCFAISVSLGLQHGVPLERYVDSFVQTRFEPNGPVQHHDNIKNATSLMDLIFRHLAIVYQNRQDLAHLPVTAEDLRGDAVTPYQPIHTQSEPLLPVLAGGAPQTARETAKQRGYAGNPCSECGQFTLVANGTCYRCDSCGSTSGCS